MQYCLYDELYEVKVKLGTYQYGNGLSIDLIQINGEPFARMTVNVNHVYEPLGIVLPNDVAAIDINNCPELPAFIEKYKLGSPLGLYCQSGYVNYPLYKFDLKRLYEEKYYAELV